MRAGQHDRLITIERKATPDDLGDYLSPNASYGTEEPVWVPLVREGNAASLALSGADQSNWFANYAETASSAALQAITAVLDVRIRFALRGWVPGLYQHLINRWEADSNESWGISITSDGVPYIQWSSDGQQASAKVASATLPGFTAANAASMRWLRVLHVADNGAGNSSTKFYLGDTLAGLSQLGVEVLTAGTLSIFPGTRPIWIGSLKFAGGAMNGLVNYAEVRNGDGGTVAATFDPTRAKRGATTVSSITGEVWTINEASADGLTARLVGGGFPGERFWAQVQDALPSRSEAVTQGLVVARNQTRIRLRYRDDIDSSMRVRLHGDGDDVIYQIVGGPAAIGARKDRIEIVCERYSS